RARFRVRFRCNWVNSVWSCYSDDIWPPPGVKKRDWSATCQERSMNMRVFPTNLRAAALVPAILLYAGFLSTTSARAGPPSETPDLSAYEAAKAGVGRDPEAHIALALWCEAHGLHSERVKHLAFAVLTDPTNATARGLLGLVEYRGRWQRPDAVAEKV